jgi:1-acyl-sn-glycerol-3-phosphate acyltransferase
MPALKKINRLFLLILTSFIMLFPAIFINLALNFFYTRKSRYIAGLTAVWAKLCCRILDIRVQACGQYNVKEPGFIASNHISYTDILVLASIAPCSFLSKKDVKKWPLVGLLAILGDTVFIDRSTRSGIPTAIKELDKKLMAGVNAVVFPEGTTSDGTDVMPFKSSFFELPLLINCPVISVTIIYSDSDTDPDAKTTIAAWYGNEPFIKHFWRLLGCPVLRVKVHFNTRIETGNIQTRKELAALTHKIIRNRYKNIAPLS